jgi:hypothetical protein
MEAEICESGIFPWVRASVKDNNNQYLNDIGEINIIPEPA